MAFRLKHENNRSEDRICCVGEEKRGLGPWFYRIFTCFTHTQLPPVSTCFRQTGLPENPVILVDGICEIISTLRRTDKSRAMKLVSDRDESRTQVSGNQTKCSVYCVSQGAHLYPGGSRIFRQWVMTLGLGPSICGDRVTVFPRMTAPARVLETGWGGMGWRLWFC